MIKRIGLSLFGLFFAFTLAAQTGTVRGNVLEKETGEPVMFATVRLQGTTQGTTTDLDGFFSLGNIPVGDYKLVVTYVGFDSIGVDITVQNDRIISQQLFMESSGINLGTVNVSARKEQAQTEVQISSTTLSPKQISSLPSTGGEPDIAQYLPVLPGIVSTGDQGGQLYIRGGSPIQNLIMLDGMTIFNPFHSIGFFSVFETETIRSVDVMTGGFNAEYGGRISAVVDIKTREGNKKRFGGQVSASPFMGKVLLEGPFKKLADSGGGSSSFLVTAKHSYINETSPSIYPYAVSAIDTAAASLPFNFTDIYGKVSFLSGNGSKLNLFGFNFNDRVNYSIADLVWNSRGGGANFTLVPPASNFLIGGTLAYSDYDISLTEGDEFPRTSKISSYSAQLDFSYFGYNNEVKYGFIFNGLSTDFEFRNFLGVTIDQFDFTTELAGFIKYKQILGNLIIEPSLRVQSYPSQGSTTSIEPRIGAKYKATDKLRFKLAAGIYSQNILSSVNERDVINLFVGFLSGPEETLFEPGTETPTSNNLQKAIHGIFGLELDLSDNLELNAETYIKNFGQLIELNRNRQSTLDPQFVTETGKAYGFDLSLRYEQPNTYIWVTYSLGYVNRNDGEQIYPTIFDRRHNINFLATYAFGEKKDWEASLRWNYGSPFPFTQTQGFYGPVDFLNDGLDTDVTTNNPDLGILYSEDRNGGRLSPYHRLDVSVKKTIEISKHSVLEVVASSTNMYNRQNIFFIDRTTTQKVYQLPILPSLTVRFKF